MQTARSTSLFESRVTLPSETPHWLGRRRALCVWSRSRDDPPCRHVGARVAVAVVAVDLESQPLGGLGELLVSLHAAGLREPHVEPDRVTVRAGRGPDLQLRTEVAAPPVDRGLPVERVVLVVLGRRRVDAHPDDVVAVPGCADDGVDLRPWCPPGAVTLVLQPCGLAQQSSSQVNRSLRRVRVAAVASPDFEQSTNSATCSRSATTSDVVREGVEVRRLDPGVLFGAEAVEVEPDRVGDRRATVSHLVRDPLLVIPRSIDVGRRQATETTLLGEDVGSRRRLDRVVEDVPLAAVARRRAAPARRGTTPRRPIPCPGGARW
jgi:hypothetical protein